MTASIADLISESSTESEPAADVNSVEASSAPVSSSAAPSLEDVVNGVMDRYGAEAYEEVSDPVSDAPEQHADQPEEDPPFAAHPRWQQVLQQRDTARQEAERVRTEHEAFRQEAESWRARAEDYEQVQTFMREYGVSDQEAADALQIAALLKHNPQVAYQRLQPIVQDLMTRTGSVIPAELQAQVDQGYLTEAAARELSRARASATLTQEQMQRQLQQMQEREQAARDRQAQDQAAREAQARSSAAEVWQQQRAAADPDFARKLPLVEWAARSLLAQSMPRTASEVTSLLDRAYSMAESQIQSFRPKAPPKSPTPTGRSTPGLKADASQASSPFEAAMMGLERL